MFVGPDADSVEGTIFLFFNINKKIHLLSDSDIQGHYRSDTIFFPFSNSHQNAYCSLVSCPLVEIGLSLE